MGEERIERGFKGTKLQLNRRNKFWGSIAQVVTIVNNNVFVRMARRFCMFSSQINDKYLKWWICQLPDFIIIQCRLYQNITLYTINVQIKILQKQM
jgi:hypothetical protein